MTMATARDDDDLDVAVEALWRLARRRPGRRAAFVRALAEALEAEAAPPAVSPAAAVALEELAESLTMAAEHAEFLAQQAVICQPPAGR